MTAKTKKEIVESLATLLEDVTAVQKPVPQPVPQPVLAANPAATFVPQTVTVTPAIPQPVRPDNPPERGPLDGTPLDQLDSYQIYQEISNMAGQAYALNRRLKVYVDYLSTTHSF